MTLFIKPHSILFVMRYSDYINLNPKMKCQEEGKQLLGAGQMKDRKSSNLSVKLGDNQGAMEAERLQSGSDS